jgi:predicted metal-dependent hydrolase
MLKSVFVLSMGNAPKASDSRWAQLKGYRKLLGKAQRLLDSFWAIRKGN